MRPLASTVPQVFNVLAGDMSLWAAINLSLVVDQYREHANASFA
jgi:hypothetical protein